MSSLTPAIPRARSHERLFGLARTFLIMAILFAAFGLRVYNIGWGLPYTDHPDEPSAVNRVFGMLRRDDWNPQFFGKPSLYYYILRVVFAAHLQYGINTGLYTGIASLPETTDLYVTTPGFFVVGRFVTVLLGTATVALLYRIGRRWWGGGVGLAAALLMALSPFHVRNSQYITQDVPSTLTTLLAISTSLMLLRRPSWLLYALSGFTIGLAAGTKYNVALVACVTVVIHVLTWRGQSLRQVGRLFWAGGWSIVGFVATTPYALLTPGDFWHGLTHQYVAYNPSGDEASATWPVLGYLRFFWQEGLFPLPSIAALVGAAVVVARRDRAGLALLCFIVIYPPLFVMQEIHFYRNMLPIFPPLYLLAAIGVAATAQKLVELSRRTRLTTWHNRARWAVGGVLTLLILAAPVRGAIGETRFYAQPHSKVRAGAFIEEELPHGAPIAAALHPVQWSGYPLMIPNENVAEHDAAWYRSQGFRYVIADVKKAGAAYHALRREAKVLATFRGEAQGAPGPLLEALDLGRHDDQLAIERREAVFGEQLRLLGFQSAAGQLRGAFSALSGGATIEHGQALQLNLYWQPLTKINRDYAIFLHLLDSAGQKVAQRDTVIRAADYPTSHWKPGELAIDVADLPVPADLLAGSYQLVMGVYSMDTMQALNLAGGATSVPLLTLIVQ